MANLSEIDKLKLEAIFSMSSGYVLDFSNQNFQRFIFNTIQVDIYHDKYAIYGESKAKRLKALWEMESDFLIGKLTEQMLIYYQTKSTIQAQDVKFNSKLFEECMSIANRLQGKATSKGKTGNTEEDFLKIEVDEIDINALSIDSTVIGILKQRVIEVKLCLKHDASLSVIFLSGSILEGVLLGVASSMNKEFNQSPKSPKSLQTGSVKQFHEWTLNNFIEVAHDLKIIGLDVKKYSHALRDFRNYIHPYAQMSSSFTPDKHTAKISWQVLKAALHDIYEYQKSRKLTFE